MIKNLNFNEFTFQKKTSWVKPYIESALSIDPVQEQKIKDNGFKTITEMMAEIDAKIKNECHCKQGCNCK